MTHERHVIRNEAGVRLEQSLERAGGTGNEKAFDLRDTPLLPVLPKAGPLSVFLANAVCGILSNQIV